MKLNKAAMFGLDARIALAIFGALSVISGAALYSAIQKASIISYVTDLKEIGKAMEQYYLDTGSHLPLYGSYDVVLSANDLRENDAGVANWNGPYVSHPANDVTPSYAIEHSKYGKIRLFKMSINDAWGGTYGVDSVMPSTCTGTEKPCGFWVSIDTNSKDLVEGADVLIDGNLDYKNGKSRIYINGSAYYVYLLAYPEQ